MFRILCVPYLSYSGGFPLDPPSYVSFFSCLCPVQNSTQYSRCRVLQVTNRKEESFNLLALLLLIQPFINAKEFSWLMFNLAIYTPQDFFCKAASFFFFFLFNMSLSCSRRMALCFPSLNLLRFHQHISPASQDISEWQLCPEVYWSLHIRVVSKHDGIPPSKHSWRCWTAVPLILIIELWYKLLLHSPR